MTDFSTPGTSNGGAASTEAADGGTDPRTERIRTAVVAAGAMMLSEHGPDRINHAAIASAAGVSRTTLYKYWPTRAQLLHDILVGFDTHPAIPSTGDVRADLLTMLHDIQVGMSDPVRRRMFSSMLAQSQWDADLIEAQNSLRAIHLAGLTDLFAAAVEQGEIVEGVDPTVAAGRLIGPLVFAALVAQQDVMEVDTESIVDDWLSTVRASTVGPSTART